MKRPVLPSTTSVRVVGHGSTMALLVEVVLTAIVAATVVFFVGIVVKRPIDGAAFYFQAAFDRYAEQPAGTGGAGATVFPAMPVVRDPGPTGSLAFTPYLETVEVVIVPNVANFARDVLGSNAAGPRSADEALVDVDTALRLGLTVGDLLVLDTLVVGADRVATARVAGFISPYVTPIDHATGLVVFPANRADAGFVEDVSRYFIGDAAPRTRLYGPPADGREGLVDRSQTAWSFVAQMVGAEMLAALGGIAVFAGMLWVAVASRLIGRAIRRATPAAAVLVALGESPVRARRAALTMPLLALLVGQVLGIAVMAAGVFPLVMRLTLQPPSILPILMVLAALSVLMIALAGRVVGEALGPGNLVRSLTGEDELS